MTGFIVQFKDTNEYLNGQGLRVEKIQYAVVFDREQDAILVAGGQGSDTVVLQHEYTQVDSRAGTYHEFHRTF